MWRANRQKERKTNDARSCRRRRRDAWRTGDSQERVRLCVWCAHTRVSCDLLLTRVHVFAERRSVSARARQCFFVASDRQRRCCVQLILFIVLWISVLLNLIGFGLTECVCIASCRVAGSADSFFRCRRSARFIFSCRSAELLRFQCILMSAHRTRAHTRRIGGGSLVAVHRCESDSVSCLRGLLVRDVASPSAVDVRGRHSRHRAAKRAADAR